MRSRHAWCGAMLPAVTLSAIAAAAAVPTAPWTADATKASIPNQPLAGELYGKPFVPDHVTVGPYRQESGPVGAPPTARVEGWVVTFKEGNEEPPQRTVTL